MKDKIWDCTVNEITLGEFEYYSTSSSFQQVYYNGVVIGIVIKRTGSILAPIHTVFISTIHTNLIDGIVYDIARTIEPSESFGYSECYFPCLQDMVDVYTHINMKAN